MCMTIRMDSLSRPVKAFVFLGIDGIGIKPKVSPNPTFHFSSDPHRDYSEAKRAHLQNIEEYYGAKYLDPRVL